MVVIVAPLLLSKNEKVTAWPLTATPVSSVTVAVIISVLPAPISSEEPLLREMLYDVAPSVPLSPPLPQAVIKHNKAKQMNTLINNKNRLFVNFAILLSFLFKAGDDFSMI
jgi:hypothetical protein